MVASSSARSALTFDVGRLEKLAIDDGYTELYLRLVKTAISVPDETFDRASRRAADLGISRSEFFARAAQRYLDALDSHSVVSDIDATLERLTAPDDSGAWAVSAAHDRLADADEDW